MRNEINQKQIAKMLAERHNTLNAEDMYEILDMFKLIVAHSLRKGKPVNLVGFGKFFPFTRYARGGVNPRKPEEKITIPETKVAKFKAGSKLKRTIKQ